jgi:tetratricopeptide (TPR) repeat protein
MRRTGEPPKPRPIIIVQQIQKHEWTLRLPRVTEEVDDRLEEGIDSIDADPEHAESIFLELVRDYPEHIDAHHHLALTLEKMGQTEEAFQIRQQGVTMALQFFPAHFSMEQDRLEWGWVLNRPFLRLYHSFGLQLMNRGKTEEALEVFENILVLNPNDNQGARALVVGCHFALGEPSGVLSVCRQYPEDGIEDLLYGKALALFQFGKVKQAVMKALNLAIKFYPLVRAELLKTRHKKPKGADELHITLGGADQAHLYWKRAGRFWRRTLGAIDFLRNRLPGGKRRT